MLVARVHVVLEDQDLRPGERPTPASASVFIKHAADIEKAAYHWIQVGPRLGGQGTFYMGNN